ncbi:hypothetical protein PVA45_04565 [Entomospira entomophila]|uniref:DUF1574 domain-containing protein n=1 Tax=Entomospira entomophila TaxID=2719988 RepID=A0A968GBW3_9SPIO|nr:hypothetical protein [Entomospira entomophilus]NIZ40778.1 hypothetical protein [Entomospira entomophilus]WDI34991.1 hypothetical protein PVA45_04565 [Entomospira entomophilus]
MHISHKKWVLIYFSIIIPLLLIIPIYNYHIDSDFIFNNTNSPSHTKLLQSAKLLHEGASLSQKNWHGHELILLKILHFSLTESAPEVMILGTSQVANIGQDIIGKDSTFNASITGGELAGIIAMWEQYKLKPRNPNDQVLLEIYITQGGDKHVNFIESTLNYVRPPLYPYIKNFFQNHSKIQNKTTNDIIKQRINHLKSLPYAIKNFQASHSNNLLIDTNSPLILPDSSYNQMEHLADNESQIEHATQMGIKLQDRLIDIHNFEFSSSILMALLADMKAHGVKPIFLLTPLNPITYELAQQYNDFYPSIESWLRTYASEHDITIIGSYNPAKYNLSTSDFFDANHPRANAWRKIFSSISLM